MVDSLFLFVFIAGLRDFPYGMMVLLTACEYCFRNSEEICVILPSLCDVKEALSMAVSWLENAKLFLVSKTPLPPAFSSSLPKLETLKVLADFCLLCTNIYKKN